MFTLTRYLFVPIRKGIQYSVAFVYPHPTLSLSIFLVEGRVWRVRLHVGYVECEQKRHRTGTSRSHTSNIVPEQLAERFGELILSPYSWKFTAVSVDSRPRSYLLTSATLRIPVHTAAKCGTIWRPTFEISSVQHRSAVTEIAPKLPSLCVNRSPIWYSFRAGEKAIFYSMNAA